jgi:hypothetical protein
VTWTNVPWALDGAEIPSSIARLGQYVATGAAEGIAQLGDLKVTPLDTPGNGVKVLAGGAAVLNRYQGETPDQTYMVYNPTVDVLGPSDMPASSGSALSHLVCVTIGDPEFTSVGHPWMLGTDPPIGEENTFQYVRTFVIQNVPSNTTHFDALNLNYPAYALARIDVPASTTTITSDMIVELREMAAPRTKEFQWHVSTSVADLLAVATAGTYEYWPDNSQQAVAIPKWASYVYIDGFIEGFRIIDDCIARMRVAGYGTAMATSPSYFDDKLSGTADRRGISLGGRVYVPLANRGTTQNFQIQATVEDTGLYNNKLDTDSRTSAMVHMRFVEEPD